MKTVFDSMSAHSGIILTLLSVLLLILLGLSLQLSAKLTRIHSRWSELMKGSQSEDLERLLYDHLEERTQLKRDLQRAQQRIADLESKMSTAKRHMGLVRFDAFEDVGGAQSFALALFDDQGNGAVLNGLIGRSDARVYCKPLVAGRSDRALSQEESRAVEEAGSVRAQAVVTS